MAYNSFVTEYFLAQNFTPRSGITPGTDNQQWMTCDEILARYNVSISGITSTGLRWPSEGEIVNAAVSITQIEKFTMWGNSYTVSSSGNNLNTNANYMLVMIATQGGGRTGGTPTFWGSDMSLVASVGHIEMWMHPIYSYTDKLFVSIPNQTYKNVNCLIRTFQYNGTSLNQFSSVSDSDLFLRSDLSVNVNTYYPGMVVDFMSIQYAAGTLPPDSSGYDLLYIYGGGVSLSTFSQAHIFLTPPATSPFTTWYESDGDEMDHLSVSFYVY